MTEKNYILSAEAAEKKLKRMALQVVENNYEESKLLLIGIKDNGLIIAKKMKQYLQEDFTGEITVIELDINKREPGNITLNPTTDFTGCSVLLIDDVANSGRTMLYALKPLLNSYPAKIQTLALVERTHKHFPIAVDYVGLSISTRPDQHIFVEVENGEVVGARMLAPK